MESDGGFGLWGLAIVGGPVLLGLILAYGIYHSRRRSRRLDDVSEQVTEANYAAENRREEKQERRPF
jgi:hypothetical protein